MPRLTVTLVFGTNVPLFHYFWMQFMIKPNLLITVIVQFTTESGIFSAFFTLILVPYFSLPVFTVMTGPSHRSFSQVPNGIAFIETLLRSDKLDHE